MGYPKHPLFQETAFHLFGAALFVRTVVQDLFVCTDGFAGTAIPHLGFPIISKAFLIDIFPDSFLAGIGNPFRYGQFVDVFPFPSYGIKPGVVQFGKDPLRPFKIGGISGIYFTVPVITQTERLNLTSEIVAIFWVVSAGCVPVWMAYCSAGKPNASQPIG